MEKYVITDKFVNFSIGDVLGLTDKQYESRQHLLKKLKDGKYYVSQTVQFKCGEIVGLEKAPAKEMLSKITSCEAKPVPPPQSLKEKKKDDAKG